MLRSSSYNPKLANSNKKQFKEILEYLRPYVNQVISDLMQLSAIPSLPPKSITNQIDLPARLSQVIAKSASANARSLRNKMQQAVNRQKAGFKLKKYQLELVNAKIPEIKTLNLELDSRFVEIQPSKTGFCDYWIKLSSFYIPRYENKKLIRQKAKYIPLRLTGHMKDLLTRGFSLRTNAIRINWDGTLGLYWEKNEVQSTGINTLGIDIGMNKAFVGSNRQKEQTHAMGHLLRDLFAQLRNKRKTSTNKNSNKIKHIKQEIKNQINYSLKQINWSDLNTVYVEKITGMKSGKRNGFTKNIWSYRYILNKIRLLAQEHGVHVLDVNPMNTSRICSCCGASGTRKDQEIFVCSAGCEPIDADLNAALNIHMRGAYSPSSQSNKAIYSYTGVYE